MYQPILNVFNGQWQLGKIINHIAETLTKEEIEIVAKKLNLIEDPTDLIVCRDEGVYQCRRRDFVDLQESDSSFADTPIQAVEAFIKDFPHLLHIEQ